MCVYFFSHKILVDFNRQYYIHEYLRFSLENHWFCGKSVLAKGENEKVIHFNYNISCFRLQIVFSRQH